MWYGVYMAYKNPADQKAAMRRHYEDNKGVYAARTKRIRQELRDIVRSAKNVPCADCKQRYPSYVMQFDHLPGTTKCFNIGASVCKVGRVQLLSEIEKCEVVCANCHAERTYSRSVIR